MPVSTIWRSLNRKENFCNATDLTAQTAFTLINPQTKELAFKVFEFDDENYFNRQRVYNYYSMLLVTEGAGKLEADFSEYQFKENVLMCFSVYQPFVILSEST